MIVTDHVGNRWDKREWMEFMPGQNGEAAWNWVVYLTERIASLEAENQRLEECYAAALRGE